MTPERFAQIDRICDAALELPPDRRATFIDSACGTDEELRAEVESLLDAHEQAGDFIAQPALRMAVDLFEDAEPAAPTLAPGHVVGHYRLLTLLGAGGMGEVYLAEDTRLARKVAVKLLPKEFTDDTDRIQRFELEARAASALNHPNILTIYEIGRAGDVYFIAAEHVEGETLRALMTTGRMRLADAVDVAAQVASALDVAHTAGVIHRDIKPENVMMRRDRIVKLLDFGLTKLTEKAEPAAPRRPAAANLWPGAMDHTNPGLVMGTVRYMSPEQTRDSSHVDHRTDIWSLGVVLYEMVAGCAPFEGEDVRQRIVAIQESNPPPLAAHAGKVPERLEAIVRKALAKDVEERYRTAKDLLHDLRNLARRLEDDDEIARSSPQAPIAGATEARNRGLLVASGLFALLAVGGFGVYRWGDRGLTANNVSAAPIPRILPFTSFPGAEMEPSFSPDGKQITFSWNGPDGDNYDIYVKPLESGSPRRLTSHPAGDRSPAWSADGRSISFIRSLPHEDVIVLVSADGGSERIVQSVTPPSIRLPGHSLSWSPDGQSLAFSDRTSPVAPFQIHLLSVATLARRSVTSPPAGIHGDRFPAISPDGRMLAFIRRGRNDYDDVYLARVSGGGEATRLTGDNSPITGLAWTSDGREIIYSSNRGGARRVWKVPASGGVSQLVPVGEESPNTLAVSRQGRLLAYSSTLSDTNIWRVDIQRHGAGGSPPVKLISSTRTDVSPQYSPDGTKIVFSSSRTGSLEIWTCKTDGSDAVKLTSFGGPGLGTPRWSPDGRHVAFDSLADGQREIYVVSVDGGKPRRLTFEPSADVRPSWSTDGRFIYFGSDRTGQPQVWKAPVEGGRAVPVTRRGGREAFESPDGRFVYYAKENVPGLWRVPVLGGDEVKVLDHVRQGAWALWEQGVYFVNPDAPPRRSIEFYSFASGRTKPVATIDKEILWSAPNLATTADGRQILYVQVDQTESDIILVENFVSDAHASRR